MEASVCYNETTRRNMPEGCHHTHCRESLKSHISYKSMLFITWTLCQICLFEFLRVEGARSSWTIVKGGESYKSLGSPALDSLVCAPQLCRSSVNRRMKSFSFFYETLSFVCTVPGLRLSWQWICLLSLGYGAMYCTWYVSSPSPGFVKLPFLRNFGRYRINYFHAGF
jgi:hypothetical protein